MRAHVRLFSAAGCVAVLASACGENPAGERTETPESLREAVRAMGFRTDMIEDHGTFLLVEGDVYLPKEQLRVYRPQRSTGPRYQYTTTNLVSSTKINQIKVDLSGLSSQTGW